MRDRAVVTRTGTKSRSAERPYPGARPFESTDKHRFFGRVSDSSAVTRLWRDNRLTILHGRAGTGKTSLLRAGVLPMLRSGSAEALPLGSMSGAIGTGTFPLAALGEHNPYTLALLRSWSPTETTSRLVGRTVRDFISPRAEGRSDPILAAIDQAEELMLDPGSRAVQHQRFASELAEALDTEPRLHLLLCTRTNALELLTKEFGNGVQYRLTALSPESALDAAMAPVERTDRRFEAAAAEELVADLLTSHIVTADGQERTVSFDHVEPALLQVVCADLWESMPADADVITASDMRIYGDVDRALTNHCERVIALAGDRHGESPARLRSWLVRSFITDLGTPGSACEGITETARMPNAVAQTLEQLHLLSAERRSGARWYELLSDRLIEPIKRAKDGSPPRAEPVRYLELARQAQAVNHLDLAERYASRFLRASSRADLRLSAEANSLLGDIAYERGKPADAEAHYRISSSLFEAVRDTVAVANQLSAVGQTLLAQGEVAGALKELQAAADRSPHDLLLQTEFGWALWKLGQGRAAVAILNGVLALDGGYRDALRARGEILADLGEARAALRDLDRVIGNDWPSTRAARGLALAGIGDYSAASKEISRAVDDAPRNGPVLFYASRAEALGGDKCEAAALAERAASASDPPMPPHQRGPARILAGQSAGDY